MSSTSRKHCFYDRVHQRQVQRILPGEYLALTGNGEDGQKPEMMMTVLGSCVTVCLTDIDSKTAGMNHFMLPNASALNTAISPLDPHNASARYGVNAMELLINDMMRLGATRSRLQAWVFGGARVLSAMSDIGQGNIDFALRYLKTEKISVSAQNTGGILPRKIYLDPIVGIPACFSIAKVNQTFNRDENSYAQALTHSQPEATADVSLFSEAAQ
jgi:chemotaxis protein CheD